jgi:hypothetical protein
MATSFSGGRSQSTRRKPPTMGKQLVNFINLEIYTVTGKQKWTLISLKHTDLLFLAFII